jgi:hypothetical protein
VSDAGGGIDSNPPFLEHRMFYRRVQGAGMGPGEPGAAALSLQVNPASDGDELWGAVELSSYVCDEAEKRRGAG